MMMMMRKTLLLLLLSLSAALAVIPEAPQRPEDRWSYKAEQPPIAEVIRDHMNKPDAFDDPLDLVTLGANGESSEYVKKVKEMLKPPADEAVEWLDSSNDEDRQLLGYMFKYCTNLFVHKGAHPDCVVQCHPKVDCDTQAARNCQPVKEDYEAFVRCTDKEHTFCRRFGEFNGEKFPQFRNVRKQSRMSEREKIDDVATYCGNLFQWRGLRLPCLRECTIFQWKKTDPGRFYTWKEKHRIRTKMSGNAGKDPTTDVSEDQRNMNACEDIAISYCRFISKDFYRECYERQKMACLDKTTAMHPVLPTRFRLPVG